MLTAPELAALAARLRLLPAGRTSGISRPQLLAAFAGALRADPPATGRSRVRAAPLRCPAVQLLNRSCRESSTGRHKLLCVLSKALRSVSGRTVHGNRAKAFLAPLSRAAGNKSHAAHALWAGPAPGHC